MESYSPEDLNFQTYFNLTVQKALDYGVHNISQCITDVEICGEGNLDIQYIMCLAQKTTSYFWYVHLNSSMDPHLDDLIQIQEADNPPLVNSISWGSMEQLSSKCLLILSSHPHS